MSKKDNLARKDQDVKNKDSGQEEALKLMQAKKLQMLSKKTADLKDSSPLQISLMQSEALRAAQKRIIDLEEELEVLRENNESLTSASEVLKERIDELMAETEDMRRQNEDEKASFLEEKQTLLSVSEDMKKQLERLKTNKKQLEKRLDKDLQSIRIREHSLENRLDLLKMDGELIQKSKDDKIIDLQKSINKLNLQLENSNKKNQELKNYIDELKESSRKIVSVLRATVYNLEGRQVKDATSLSDDERKEESE